MQQSTEIEKIARRIHPTSRKIECDYKMALNKKAKKSEFNELFKTGCKLNNASNTQ
jgi:hypothetical protein